MLAFLLALQVGLPATADRLPKQPPNILIVVVDDLGIDQVGCYATNYPQLAEEPCTPNIDALAEAGMRFTNAWANPNCSPSRAAIHTGRRARRTGLGTIAGPINVPGSSLGLQLEQPSLPRLLSGYSSAALGKWHLSDWVFVASAVQHPIEMGYQSYAGALESLDGAYNDWTKTLLPEEIVLTHYGVYATVDTTHDALARIATLPEPWLLYVAYNAAHTPLHCPLDLDYTPLITPPGECATDWCVDCTTLLSTPPTSSYPTEVVQSRAVVHALDHELGRLFAAVNMKDTAVILTSDNGSDRRTVVPPFPSDRAKGTIYQGGINVPLVVAVPGGQKGECHQLVQLRDLHATVADLARVPLPPDPLRDSVSLMQYVRPALAAPGSAPRSHVFTEAFGPNYLPQPDGEAPAGYVAAFNHRAVRNATHKLVEIRWGSHTGGGCNVVYQLFRLADEPLQDPAYGPDPHEQTDLMLDTSSWSPETLGSFIELSGLLTEVYAPLPVGSCP